MRIGDWSSDVCSSDLQSCCKRATPLSTGEGFALGGHRGALFVVGSGGSGRSVLEWLCACAGAPCRHLLRTHRDRGESTEIPAVNAPQRGRDHRERKSAVWGKRV